jgi:hypothetical protein
MKWPPSPIPLVVTEASPTAEGKHSYTWAAEIVIQPSEENLNAGMAWVGGKKERARNSGSQDIGSNKCTQF